MNVVLRRRMPPSISLTQHELACVESGTSRRRCMLTERPGGAIASREKRPVLPDVFGRIREVQNSRFLVHPVHRQSTQVKRSEFAPKTSREPKEGYEWDAESGTFKESDGLVMERFKVAHGLFTKD